jgi:hypothetical protein
MIWKLLDGHFETTRAHDLVATKSFSQIDFVFMMWRALDHDIKEAQENDLVITILFFQK